MSILFCISVTFKQTCGLSNHTCKLIDISSTMLNLVIINGKALACYCDENCLMTVHCVMQSPR